MGKKKYRSKNVKFEKKVGFILENVNKNDDGK
jgi:hypothetical protein